MDDPKEVKRRIGYMPEQPPLYMDMTVIDFLDFVGELKTVDKKKRRAQINDIMELVQITHVSKRLVKNLSKGYKQRVGLAQALIGSPEVLILDEPTIGLDPKQIIEIRKLIRALGKEHTIILSTHILPEVSMICDRVVIINKGVIAAVDTPANLSKLFAKAMKYTMRVAGPKNQVTNLLKSIYGVKNAEPLQQKEQDSYDYLIETLPDIDVRKPIFYELSKFGYPILELKSIDMSLEDIFLQVVTEESEVE